MHGAASVDEAELGQLARLVAHLTPAQQRLVVALADGFRGGWLEPFSGNARGGAAIWTMMVSLAMRGPGWPAAGGTPWTDGRRRLTLLQRALTCPDCLRMGAAALR